jgi:hypothetical protein
VRDRAPLSLLIIIYDCKMFIVEATGYIITKSNL